MSGFAAPFVGNLQPVTAVVALKRMPDNWPTPVVD